MKAVVLCGGKGTRLRPYTHTLPKPMLLLGRKPILEYAVEHLKREGFHDIVFTVGHLKHEIMNYFGDGKKFGVKITYSHEENELGTAGSVAGAKALLKGEENFLVIMGDQLTNLDFRKLTALHEKKKPLATIGLKRMGVPFQYGTVEASKDGDVTGFVEKPIFEKLVNAGIYVFNKRIFDYLQEKGDFALNVFPELVARKQRVAGFVFDDYWIDVGNLKEYEEINQTISLVDLITSISKGRE